MIEVGHTDASREAIFAASVVRVATSLQRTVEPEIHLEVAPGTDRHGDRLRKEIVRN